MVEHSLNVYQRLNEFTEVLGIDDSKESMAIKGLFHDLTKANCYKSDFRNVKNEAGTWERVPYYRFEEDFAFGGHGAKSVYLIQKYMKLTDDEAVCINCHMGAFDKPCGDYSISNAYDMFPSAMVLHMADMAATYIDENKKPVIQEDPLKEAINEIVLLCKNIIKNGVDKEEVYAIIATHNNDKKNPNAIKEIEIANTIIEELKGLL